MDFYNRFRLFLSQAIDIPSADPDDSRRRRLLSIILFGVALVSLLTTIVATLLVVTSGETLQQNTIFIFVSGLATFIGSLAIYAINRYLSGRFASILFLVFLMVVLAFADTIPAMVNGRSLFLFLVPIIISSVLLGPSASFIFYALVTAEILLMARIGDVPPNIPALISFLLLTLLSWLSSRSLEEALHDVRETNANLDRLVSERTQTLAASLAREHAEAGQRRAILNSIADGVVVFDMARKAILANPAAQDLLMQPVDQMIGKSFNDLVDFPTISSIDRGLLLTMMDTRTQLSSFRITWGKKTLSVSAALVQDSDGREIGTVTVFRDVTRETELERAKSAFIAIVSHELRTPLNAIIGFAEMLREKVYGPVTREQVDASNRILTNSRHMFSMVGDLLDQAQIEAGKLRIAVELFRPAELLKNVQDVMNQTVVEKGLTLTGEMDADLPDSFTGDPQRLQQILMNLVNNAVKFTDRGSVNIRMFVAEPGRWGLEVRDTGRGIPTEQIQHVFDPFYQVDTTATRQQGGFGLGLSIVKQLVGLMEGKISVESTPGVGSIFTVTLPLKGVGSRSRRSSGPLALIVEDDADLSAIFAEAVKAAGFEPQVIRDGAMAQRRIKEVVPDIVILDLHLPHVDGSTLLNQIRTTAALNNTIVVVATADALVGGMYRDIADIVLIKPVSFTQLRDLCTRLYSIPRDSNGATEGWTVSRNIPNEHSSSPGGVE